MFLSSLCVLRLLCVYAHGEVIVLIVKFKLTLRECFHIKAAAGFSKLCNLNPVHGHHRTSHPTHSTIHAPT